MISRARLQNTPALRSIPLLLSLIAVLASGPVPSFAGTSLSTSGRIAARGIQEIDGDSVPEDPSLDARLKVSGGNEDLAFHGWLEGGWDGSVKRPPRDTRLFKTYDSVYQSNTPWAEFKELVVSSSTPRLDLRAGIQRFAWGRIDEYPSNDLLNPWDYSRFPARQLEDRKIGVPSLFAALNTGDWTTETVWLPVFVPYRLPLPDERWAGGSLAALLQQTPGAVVHVREPDLPDRTVANSTIGMRLRYLGPVEWTFNLFHGYDPRPVFRTTAFSVLPIGGAVVIDPGYVPDFHGLTTLGIDAAAVRGDLSLRAEASYAFHRYLNIDRSRWGYPAVPGTGAFPLNPAEEVHDTIDYGIGADYRLFEDGQVTVQVQQTLTLGNVDMLYERKLETILWGNLKAGFLNQKIETNASIAANPEHRDRMVKVSAWYVFTDAWKAGVTAVGFTGPDQSVFGRYARNDQVEAEIVYAW